MNVFPSSWVTAILGHEVGHKCIEGSMPYLLAEFVFRPYKLAQEVILLSGFCHGLLNTANTFMCMIHKRMKRTNTWRIKLTLLIE